ncbi:MAG: fatty-acid synthase [Leptospiraceae bacterium]|nr:hypothetical protein [Leptospiraceae bacterium]MCP5496032.1 fatty-acid synthase [Leptospiraceae bacterium]
MYIDLGAEPAIGAEKDGQKIAVEVKSFIGESDIHNLSNSIGQYNLYKNILEEIQPDRKLYMAIPNYAYIGVFSEPTGQLIIKKEQLKIIIFNEKEGRINQWIQ